MTIHQEFLKFEAVLAHCETRVPNSSLTAAMEYGREMQFFDRTNRLSQSGELLAEMILPTIEDWYFSVLSNSPERVSDQSKLASDYWYSLNLYAQ